VWEAPYYGSTQPRKYAGPEEFAEHSPRKEA